MAKNRPCYVCDGTLQKKSGTFRFMPPPNIPGGVMVIEEATWLECELCGDQVLPAALNQRLTVMEQLRRKGKE